MGECVLLPKSERHGLPLIRLDHLKTFVLGRSRETKIKDPKISRHHLQLTADMENCLVDIKQLGSNSSIVDSNLLRRGRSCVVKGNFLIQMVTGGNNYIEYTVQWKFPLTDKSEAIGSTACCSTFYDEPKSLSKKRKMDINLFNKASPVDSQEGDEEMVKDCGDQLAEMRKRFDEEAKLLKVKDSDNDRQMLNDDSNSRIISLKHANSFIKGWIDQKGIMIFTPEGVYSSKKIAAFDLDWTIIRTKSGRIFPSNAGDWEMLYAEVPGALKKKCALGYRIVFFSNQSGLGKNLTRKDEFRIKLENVIRKLGIPIQAFVATGQGYYRKPAIGMWKRLVDQENGSIDLSSSFYVGDAAGRLAEWKPGKKKDFTVSDRLFAINIGIKFLTPEEFFLNQPATQKFELPTFNPQKFLDNEPNSLTEPSDAIISSLSQEMIINVGCPGSGKSHFVRRYLPRYTVASRDDLGSWQNCLKTTNSALQEGNSVVVDNTNPDIESRSRFIDAARKFNVPVRCFWFPADFKHCQHSNTFRKITDLEHSSISDAVLHYYFKKFQEPKVSEGFTQIVRINFVLDFQRSSDCELFCQFLNA